MSGERVRLYHYRDELLAEVVVDEGHGDVRTVSAEFDVVDPDALTISPRGELPSEYEEPVRKRIEDSEYELRDAHQSPRA